MSEPSWIQHAIFYHIYPLGLCGAPEVNDFSAPTVERLDTLFPWLDHLNDLGVKALYLGPVFQSSSHGYDTVDYYRVDRRLGDNDTLARFSEVLHARGIRLVLDAVFNHVGREFWAFRDVQEHGADSPYCNWFYNLRFDGCSPSGDPFQYEGWHGHYSLVKLNLSHPHVRAHLLDAVGMWMDRFGIDGLRLDAADCIDFDFLRALNVFTKSRRPDFWLMGEVVHGDYRQWVKDDMLDSVTNYAAYKGLFSSLVDSNYFEIAYTLDQQFGEGGIYRNLALYNFVDNHDVDRVASKLKDPAHLYPLYLLLFTMPGIPSIYYGSEWGIEGEKTGWSDGPLRPALELGSFAHAAPQHDLPGVIHRLAELRQHSAAIRQGGYQQLHVDHQQLAFMRDFEAERVVVVLNSESSSVDLEIQMPVSSGVLRDGLNPGEVFPFEGGKSRIPLPACWGRVLRLEA